MNSIKILPEWKFRGVNDLLLLRVKIHKKDPAIGTTSLTRANNEGCSICVMCIIYDISNALTDCRVKGLSGLVISIEKGKSHMGLNLVGVERR